MASWQGWEGEVLYTEGGEGGAALVMQGLDLGEAPGMPVDVVVVPTAFLLLLLLPLFVLLAVPQLVLLPLPMALPCCYP